MEPEELQELFSSSQERNAAKYLLDANASPLERYAKRAVRAGNPRILNLSTSDDPDPLLYVTEDRIKHKFPDPPAFMRFSFPQRLVLLQPDDPHYQRGTPIAYLRLDDRIESYQFSGNTLSRQGGFPQNSATEYRVSIDYLFSSSSTLEKRFGELRTSQSSASLLEHDMLSVTPEQLPSGEDKLQQYSVTQK